MCEPGRYSTFSPYLGHLGQIKKIYLGHYGQIMIYSIEILNFFEIST